jgi:HEAT repeat protein
MGQAALSPLLESLSSVEGQGRIDPPYVQNEDGSYSVNAAMEAQRRWTEGGYIFQDEAYALGRLGEVAIDPLRQLLQSKDPWIVINAAFALGQIGYPAARAIDDLTVRLDSADHRVVRAILESIACIGSNTEAALPAIKKILRTDRETWNQDTDLPFLVGDQIHFNAALALLSSDLPIMVMEDFLLELLERPADRNFVQAIALEVLLRNPSESSLPQVLKYLQVHCWDDTEMSY